MNFHQLITILWSRKSIIMSVLMITVVMTQVVTLLLSKQYIATTSIVVEQSGVDPVTGQTIQIQLMPRYMATQVDVISSHNVARKVVEKLNLIENPQMQKDNPKMKSDYTKAGNIGDFRDWVADLLLKKLDIKPSPESNLIQINFASKDPKFAAVVANSFADAYMLTSIELHVQPAKLSSDWFDSQIALLRERLERVQSVLTNFQRQHGIVSTDGLLDLDNARLNELSRQLFENQARTSELQSRKDLLTTIIKQGGSSESLREVLDNSLIQSLKSQLAEKEASFAELSKRVDINHPQYKQAIAEVRSLQQKIQTEIKIVLSNITNELASSNERDKIMINTLAEQKAKVLELKKQHDEIEVFKREVENAQRGYDIALHRGVQSRMESEINQTDIAILNAALPPQKTDSYKVLLNMILSIFVGTILGAGFALLAELMDHRVRCAYDISELLGIPVFAVVSASSSNPKYSYLHNLQEKITSCFLKIGKLLK